MDTSNDLKDHFVASAGGVIHRCDSIRGTDYIANPFFLN